MPMSKSFEETIVAQSKDGLSEHDMGTGWNVIVAKHGNLCATWYYHTNDDPRIRVALRRDAERRVNLWQMRNK